MRELLLMIGVGVLIVAGVICLAWFTAYLSMYRWRRSLKEPGEQA